MSLHLLNSTPPGRAGLSLGSVPVGWLRCCPRTVPVTPRGVYFPGERLGADAALWNAVTVPSVPSALLYSAQTRLVRSPAAHPGRALPGLRVMLELPARRSPSLGHRLPRSCGNAWTQPRDARESPRVPQSPCPGRRCRPCHSRHRLSADRRNGRRPRTRHPPLPPTTAGPTMAAAAPEAPQRFPGVHGLPQPPRAAATGNSRHCITSRSGRATRHPTTRIPPRPGLN